jgi:1-acyl-sn-glycerol-3-phosphate acyltransferase
LQALRSWFRRVIVLVRIARRLVSGYLLIRFVWPFMDQRGRDESVQRWCRSVLRVMRIELSAPGRPFPVRDGEGLLLVANHVSWVDTVAIHALVPCGFLAKASLRGWPIVGHLIDRTGGVFVERGNPFALQRALDAMALAIAGGRSICVFPEGTTTHGTSVASFSTLVFELSARRGVGVLPIGVRYLDHGLPTQVPAWVGDEAFLPSLYRIAASDALSVEVIVGERLAPAADRLLAAEQARARVAAMVGVPLSTDASVESADSVTWVDDETSSRVSGIAEAVRNWIAEERKTSAAEIADLASLRSLGIDSLSILNMVIDLEKRMGLRVDESKLELSSHATVRELSAALARCEK